MSGFILKSSEKITIAIGKIIKSKMCEECGGEVEYGARRSKLCMACRRKIQLRRFNNSLLRQRRG